MFLVGMSAVLAIVVFLCISSFVVSPVRKDANRQPLRSKGSPGAE